MERRLFTFVVASTAFFIFYITLRTMFAPPMPNQNVGAAANAQVDDGDVAVVDAGNDADADPEADVPPIERPETNEWITLGSMANDSKYFMLVTLNSRGGGIERIELTERDEDQKFKYRRVDTRSGYLGYFAGEPAAAIDGVLVNVVGPGTPASLAKGPEGAVGIKPQDVIVAVGGKVVSAPDDIAVALEETRPGEEISVEVVRGDKKDPMVFDAVLTEHPLDLIRLARYGGDDQIPSNLDRLSCLLTLNKVNRKSIGASQKVIKGLKDPTQLIWQNKVNVEGDVQTAEFSVGLSAAEMKPVGGLPVQLKRTYSLLPGSFALDMAVEVKNDGDKPQDLAYRVEGANGMTLEGWWYSYKISPNFARSAARDIIYKSDGDGHNLISGFGLWKRGKANEDNDPDETIFAEDDEERLRLLKYIGIDAQYFTVAFVPKSDTPALDFFRRATCTVLSKLDEVKNYKQRAVNTSFYLDSNVATVPPGGTLRNEFRMFAGPKVPELMAQHSLSECIYYGWFSGISAILSALLHWLYALTSNYAVSIVCLTILVRAMMFPLGRKAAVNAQRMQELAPEMKKIAEKYQDDMEGRLKAQRELQQRVGFNPLAGCLPLFLQFPIFMGLYRALCVDISLRQAPMSSPSGWANNLAGPDQFYEWGDWMWSFFSGRGDGWLGPYFNILPVAVIFLFLAQQKLFMPPATDEQSAMMQKTMTIMTVMMGIFFFKFPAGLCIYFITSSLWGVGERMIVKKTLPKNKHFDPSVLDGTATEKEPDKKESLADRIRNQIAPPEEATVTPNKRKRPPGKKKR